MEIVENFLELVDIEDIILDDQYVNMVDISVDVDQSFLLSNGLISHNSAGSAYRKYRDPNTMGAFSLKGKFMNVSELPNSKLVQNNEVVNLMAAIGLKLGQEVSLKDLRYGRILFGTDADTDGDSITALLLNFFNRYWPELFERKMIYKIMTPLVAVQNRKTKKKILFYTNDDYLKWLNDTNDPKLWEIKYKKGLAALVDDEYNEIINNPNLVLITRDDLSDKFLDIWFGKSSDLRKDQIIGSTPHL
jgi:DNA gyrase subunit B